MSKYTSEEIIDMDIEDESISCPDCGATGDYNLSSQVDYDDEGEKLFSVWCHECDAAFDV